MIVCFRFPQFMKNFRFQNVKMRVPETNVCRSSVSCVETSLKIWRKLSILESHSQKMGSGVQRKKKIGKLQFLQMKNLPQGMSVLKILAAYAI